MNKAEHEEMITMEEEANGPTDMQRMFELPDDVNPSSADLKEVSEAFWVAKMDEKAAKKFYDEVKANRANLEETLLILMDNSGMESFRTGNATFSILNGVKASCRKEDNPQFFEFLESVGIDPITIVAVNSRSLASMVKEWREAGVEIPEYIWTEPTKKIGMRKR